MCGELNVFLSAEISQHDITWGIPLLCLCSLLWRLYSIYLLKLQAID